MFFPSAGGYLCKVPFRAVVGLKSRVGSGIEKEEHGVFRVSYLV